MDHADDYIYSNNTCTGDNIYCQFYTALRHYNTEYIGCAWALCPNKTDFEMICHLGEGKKYVSGNTTTGRTFELHSSISNGEYTGRPFCEDCPTSHPYC